MVYQTLAFLIISICSIQVIIKQFEIGILQEVLYQLEQKNLKPFLQDVKIIQGENPVCPSEYPLTISQYEWAGTTEGCLCKEGGIDNKYCCPAGVCQNFTCEGENISPTEAMNLNYWKNQNNDKNIVICGKFMQGISAKSQTDLKESQSGLCLDEENYKVCKSENQLTDFNICVPKNVQCPIREIKIVNQNEKQLIEKNMIQQQQQKKFLKIDDQQFIYINRQANQQPIIEFKIQNDLKICFNENEEIQDEEKERDEYLLLKSQKRQVKSCIQNSNWNKMASIKKVDLYKANKNFYSETIENLPQFKLHNYDEFHLLYLNAQPVKNELQSRWINGQEYKQQQNQQQQNQQQQNQQQQNQQQQDESDIKNIQNGENKKHRFFRSFSQDLQQIEQMGLPELQWNVERIEVLLYRFKIFIFVLLFQVIETPLKTEKLFRFQETNYQRLKKLFKIARTGLKFIVVNVLLYLIFRYQFHIFTIDTLINSLKNQSCFLYDQGMYHYLEDFQLKSQDIYQSKFMIAMFIMGYIFESNLIKIIYSLNCNQQQNQYVKDELEISQLTASKNDVSEESHTVKYECQNLQINIQVVNNLNSQIDPKQNGQKQNKK